jgi:TRAP-type C4-dicarboxylate transport system permease small subunit
LQGCRRGRVGGDLREAGVGLEAQRRPGLVQCSQAQVAAALQVETLRAESYVAAARTAAAIEDALVLERALLVCAEAALSAERPDEADPERRVRRWEPRRAWAVATGLTLGLGAAVKLVLVVLPNGLIEAIKYSLICVLWIGLIGASIATYEKRHLALEIADYIWPKAWSRVVKGLAMALTAAFVVFLLMLSALSVSEHRETWLVNPLTGVVLGTSIPLWTIYLVFPYALGVMALRFIAQVRGEA